MRPVDSERRYERQRKACLAERVHPVWHTAYVHRRCVCQRRLSGARQARETPRGEDAFCLIFSCVGLSANICIMGACLCGCVSLPLSACRNIAISSAPRKKIPQRSSLAAWKADKHSIGAASLVKCGLRHAVTRFRLPDYTRRSPASLSTQKRYYTFLVPAVPERLTAPV